MTDELPPTTRQPVQDREPAAQFRVTATALASPTSGEAAPTGARLCGGTSTCVVLFRLDPEPN